MVIFIVLHTNYTQIIKRVSRKSYVRTTHLSGYANRARFRFIRAKGRPLAVQTVFVVQMVFHVRLWNGRYFSVTRTFRLCYTEYIVLPKPCVRWICPCSTKPVLLPLKTKRYVVVSRILARMLLGNKWNKIPRRCARPWRRTVVGIFRQAGDSVRRGVFFFFARHSCSA